MDKEADLMEQDPTVIRQQIDETRSALTEKLETLEQGVKETVQEAKAAVTGTIESVKDTVESTVETVKEKVEGTVETVKQTLDITTYVENYPWAMFGGAVALGCVLGRISQSREKIGGMRNGHEDSQASKTNGALHPAITRPESGSACPPETSESAARSMAGELAHKFEPELQEIKSLAIGAVGALVRDIVKGSVPDPLAPRLEDVINRITTKLGGEAIPEPLLTTKSESIV
jgi:ElaB/YqjD/DUF883 family membrane-anchored ribosome-binding protein